MHVSSSNMYGSLLSPGSRQPQAGRGDAPGPDNRKPPNLSEGCALFVIRVEHYSGSLTHRIFGMESLTFGYREELTDEDRPEYGHDPRTGKYLKQVITAHTVVEFSVE